MVEKGLPAPTPKPVRAKILAQTKAKATPKPTTSKTNIPLECKVVIQPVDQQKDQDTLYPPNQPNQLLNIPAVQQEQVTNLPNPLNPPNPPNPPNPNKKKGGQVRFSEEVTYIPNREKTC